MRRLSKLICSVIIINFLLFGLPGKPYCDAADAKFELDWDHLTSIESDRDLDTTSLHILKKISETKNRSSYGGITITRPLGNITLDHQTRNSSAVGMGPTYLIRTEKYYSDKLSAALDISGGVILYDKAFPAGGRCYDFMWRIGPRLIYKINADSSVNVGYTLMHVSNGFKTHNPGYDAHGISLGLVTNF